MGIINKIFGKKKCLYIGDEINEDSPKKCLSYTKELKNISRTEKIEAVFCTQAASHGSFFICTDKDLLYCHNNVWVATIDRYPYASVVGISAQVKSLLKYVVLGLNGSQNIVTDVYCDNGDFAAFFDFVTEKIKKAKAVPPTEQKNVTEELIKLKQLLDANAISEEEYLSLKKRLLQ